MAAAASGGVADSGSGEHHSLIAEFAYQVKFRDRSEMKPKEMKRAEKFSLALQDATKEWLALNATEVGVVCGMMGHAPKAYE